MAEVIYDDSRHTILPSTRLYGRKEIYWYNRIQLVEAVLYEDGTSFTMEYPTSVFLSSEPVGPDSGLYGSMIPLEM